MLIISRSAVGWAAAILVIVGACSSTSGPSASTPTMPAASLNMGFDGASLDQAIAIAQGHVPAGAELWSYAPGDPNSVMQKILGPGAFDRPPIGAGDDTLLWAVAFKVGGGLTTVYLNLLTGAWLENRDTPAPVPEQHRSDMYFDAPLVHISNGTTLALKVMVNGQDAGSGSVIDARLYGDGPWTVIVSTARGRELTRMDFDAASAYHTMGSYPHTASGPARRVDLSCGRLDIWVGVPLMGPPPMPSGYPAHDCDP